MQAALALARRGLGEVWPNPSVGAVLVKEGRVVGRGFTGAGGRPHAEFLAVEQAGAAARGETCYVTLEPCCHPGRGPACADVLIGAGVSRVVVAAPDPDPRVNGGGLARLSAAGIAVEAGLMRAEAERDNLGFLRRVQAGRPMVTLKLASTLDGRIATRTGASRWITGPEARREAHALRARHDAMLVGVGTVLADDPDLTCRLAGAKRVPMVRVVADGSLRTPADSRLLRGAADQPLWLLCGPDAPAENRAALARPGVDLLEVARGDDGLDLVQALGLLGARGLTRLLAEGGSKLAAALLRADLVDRLVWFHAPSLIGGDGLPAIGALGVAQMDQLRQFRPLEQRRLGADLCSEYER